MEKLSDSWYHPINPEIIKELMVSLDVGKGKDYTSEVVFDTQTDKIDEVKAVPFKSGNPK